MRGSCSHDFLPSSAVITLFSWIAASLQSSHSLSQGKSISIFIMPQLQDQLPHFQVTEGSNINLSEEKRTSTKYKMVSFYTSIRQHNIQKYNSGRTECSELTNYLKVMGLPWVYVKWNPDFSNPCFFKPPNKSLHWVNTLQFYNQCFFPLRGLRLNWDFTVCS